MVCSLLFPVLVPLCVQLITGVSHVQGSHFLSSEEIPVTSFSCKGRATGYYADLETGCQVYHMCEASGRQFSYICPNTTLFHQRMLICAHWYQVNCSRSEFHYDANLLIGQRDKPFVSDEEHKYFNYRKRLGVPSYGVRPTETTQTAADAVRPTVASVTAGKRLGVPSYGVRPTETTQAAAAAAVRPTAAPVTDSTIQQDDKLLTITAVYDRSATVADVTANVPWQTGSGTTGIHDGTEFINRFVYEETTHNNPFIASGYKHMTGKDMSDFKIKDTSFGVPSLYLQPPRYNNEEENNKIELVFEDPRRVFYIGENGSDSVNAEPVLVTIRLNKSQMLFRNQHSCDRCHPLFITHKDTCTPCVIVR